MGSKIKKDPCPICSNEKFDLFPFKIEGVYICDYCRDKIDMDLVHFNQLTLQTLKQYMDFHAENEQLQRSFKIDDLFDLGMWNSKLIVDYDRNLFCMSRKPNKTIFEGKHLVRFVIKEDNAVLFEGSREGIYRFTSNVTERLFEMASMLDQFKMNNEIRLMMEKLGKDTVSSERLKISEPFQDFIIELTLDHPYWNTIKMEMEGPRFDVRYPEVKDYYLTYQENIKLLERLVSTLKLLAFEEMEEKSIGLDSLWGQPIRTIKASSNQAIEDLKKVKELLDKGVITKEEFDSRKEKLLRTR